MGLVPLKNELYGLLSGELYTYKTKVELVDGYHIVLLVNDTNKALTQVLSKIK